MMLFMGGDQSFSRPLDDFNRGFSRHLAETRHPLRSHLKQVARLAAALARRYGADPAGAATAGYLHDWLKPYSSPRLRTVLQRNRVRLDPVTKRTPALWHGPAAAGRARRVFHLTHPQVLDAVRWHTTGHARASRLGRAVFVADFCAGGRTYREAAIGRRLAGRSLALATRYVLASKLAYLQARGLRPHPAALAFWRGLFSELHRA